MEKQITLAIVTYRRPIKLARCLKSVSKQNRLPNQVLVIDNDSLGSARASIDDYAKSLTIKYLIEPSPGASNARNRALFECNTHYLGFVDDDCILDNNWVKNAIKAISKSKKAYIVGQSVPLNKDNMYSTAQYYVYRRWFVKQINPLTNEISPQALDTKNVILNHETINKYHIVFDTRYSGYKSSGFEDSDFGMQLNQHKLRGIYESKMLIYHEETDTLTSTIKKAYQKGKLKYLYEQKWNASSNHFLPQFKLIIFNVAKLIKSLLTHNHESALIESIDLAYNLGLGISMLKR